MTRKDYELIARAIRRSADADRSTLRLAAIETVAVLLAVDLAEGNPRFDRARFLAACGVAS